MTPTHFLSSHVGSGSDAHCLSGSAFTDATTSAGVTAENSRNTQPTGAGVKDGGPWIRVSSGSTYSGYVAVEETVQLRRADICRRRYTPTTKQLIEGRSRRSGMDHTVLPAITQMPAFIL